MTWLAALGVVVVTGQAPAPADGTISGVVFEQGTRTPVPRAQVLAALERRGPSSMSPLENRPPVVLTDADGRFSLSGLAPGRYRLMVQKAGFAVPFGPGTPPLAVELVDRVDGLELSLPRGGVIVGRVLDAHGEPTDASVSPMRRIDMGRLTRAGAPPIDAARQPQLVIAGPSVQPNELGEFRIHSLAAGEYFVRAMPRMMSSAVASGNGTALVPTYLPSTTEPTAAQAVLVAPGETSTVGDLRLVAAAAFAVSGTVVDQGGKPVARVMVRLVPRDARADGVAMMTGPAGQTRTVADGTFRLELVTEGAYTLIAVPPVVIARDPSVQRGRPSGFTSISGGGSGLGGMVTTETRNGVTVQYHDDAGTQLPVTVSGQAVLGLQVQMRAQR